jgi:hypothetical protein
MRTHLKLLTAGLVLVTAAVAGCSSTESGPAGAIENDVTITEAPASTGPTSSAEPVATPEALSAEPSAEPSVDSSEAVSLVGGNNKNNDVCDSGLAYACGNIGASGVGTVFYASSTPFACGPNGASSCNYLEVAPNGWNGKLVDCKGCGGSPNKTSDYGQEGIGTGRGYAYCSAQRNLRTVEIPNAASTVIGSGYTNTTALIQNCEAGDAGELARGYTGGGMTDWSLPSADELIALYYYPNRNAIGGFASDSYWSSSQVWNRGNNVWTGDALDFRDGILISYNYENDTLGVRPVRAF